MKKGLLTVILASLLLTACSAKETFETVDDEFAAATDVQAKQICLQLPDDAASPAMESEEAGSLYLCDGYTITVQTVPGGDLSETLRKTTGYSADNLPVMETKYGDVSRYDCVWTAAGETGDQVGRAAILDDGSFHYVVTVMAAAEDAGRFTNSWPELLNSLRIV